jgi:hypothetical protein
MNNKCHIVRDLLPSYIDKICSKESSQFIEEHLYYCEQCRNIFIDIKTEVDIPDEINKNERLETKKPFKKLSDFLKAQKKLTSYFLTFALIALLLGIVFLTNSVMEVKKYKKEVRYLAIVDKEKEVIMNDVFNVLNSSNGISNHEQLLKVFNKYKDKLNYLAIFPSNEIEDLIEENKSVKNEPTNIYPIDYQKAALVIGNEGIIDNKEQITPSDYDLGNVVKASEKWVVQYEYKSSYENTVEKYHQSEHYGPTIWSFYQLPIIFLILFVVLGFTGLLLTKHNRRLNGVID